MHTNSPQLIKERGKHPMSIHPPVIFNTLTTPFNRLAIMLKRINAKPEAWLIWV